MKWHVKNVSLLYYLLTNTKRRYNRFRREGSKTHGSSANTRPLKFTRLNYFETIWVMRLTYTAYFVHWGNICGIFGAHRPWPACYSISRFVKNTVTRHRSDNPMLLAAVIHSFTWPASAGWGEFLTSCYNTWGSSKTLRIRYFDFRALLGLVSKWVL